MVKFLCTFSLLTVFCFYAKARCGRESANRMLEKRFTECDSGFLGHLTNYPEISKAVTNSCLTNSGCSSVLTPRCEKAYKSALSEHEFLIDETAKQFNCTDSGPPYNSNAAKCSNNSANGVKTKCFFTQQKNTFSPNDNCKWISRHTVDLHCGGGERNTNICGVGGAVCAGEVVCNEQFSVSDSKTNKLETYQPDVYSVSCLSKTGRCEDTSMDECMSDKDTSIYNEETRYHQSIRPAVDKISPKNTRSIQ